MTPLRRHALVWLSQAPIADNDADTARAVAWHEAGRPFVATRRRDDGPEIGLGFCTTDPAHPELRPRRVAARIAPAHVLRHGRPPPLAEIARCPAAGTRAALFERLLRAAGDDGIDIRVYGSWMWQALTGEPHVHAESDLDVVIDAGDLAAAGRVAEFLERQEAALGLRIDGEISLAGRGEIHWRELRQDKAEMLLKTIDGMKLVPRAELGTGLGAKLGTGLGT